MKFKCCFLDKFILQDYWRNQHSIEYPTIGLYNLEEDPQELNNLAFQHPDLGMLAIRQHNTFSIIFKIFN